MIIGKYWLKRLLKLGAIYCNPAPIEITEASMDVTLGNWFWKIMHVDRINPRMKPIYYYEKVYVPDDQEFWLLPGRLYLAHTVQFVGSRSRFIIPRFATCSTEARWGIEPITAAGWGEPGYDWRWTLELHSKHHVPVAVHPGQRIGQIVYQLVIGSSLYRRNYRGTQEAEWTPEMMLPRQIL